MFNFQVSKCKDQWLKANERFGPWLFYVGFAMVLLGVNYLWLSDTAPQGFNTFRKLVSQVGRDLLYLRLLLMFARHPRFVVGYLVLRLYLAFTIASGGDHAVNVAALAIAASRDTDLRITLRIYAYTFVFFILSALALYSVGWADDITRERWDQTGHSWGLSNPGYLAYLLLALTMLWLLLGQERPLKRVATVCIGMSVLAFVLTFRLSESICLLLVALGYAVLLKKTTLSRWLVVVPVACLLLSVALACWYGPGYGSTSFESRFSIPRMIFDRDGLTFFGQDCGLVNYRKAWKHNITPLALDNAYLRLFLRNGILVAVVVMSFWTCLFWKISRMGKPLVASFAFAMSMEAFMESLVLGVNYNFLPLFFFALPDMAQKTSCQRFFVCSPRFRALASWLVAVTTVGTLIYLYVPWGNRTSYDAPYGRLSDIVPPDGFERVESKGSDYAAFVRSLPLMPSDSVLTYYDGTPNDSLQRYCYRRIALPLLDRDEQCADVCMRLRAEYLFSVRRSFGIRFADTKHHVLHYRYGYNRPALNVYLKEVFRVSNTESMKLSMPQRKLADVQPGDVFVYDAKSRPSARYGHAMMVADVAIHRGTGRKAILLLEGSTPASNIHLVRNVSEPDVSPWFILDENADETETVDGKANEQKFALDFGVARYHVDELFRFDETCLR